MHLSNDLFKYNTLQMLEILCSVAVKASKSGDQSADMTLLLFGPRYDRQLLSVIDEVDKADAEVTHLVR